MASFLLAGCASSVATVLSAIVYLMEKMPKKKLSLSVETVSTIVP